MNSRNNMVDVSATAMGVITPKMIEAGVLVAALAVVMTAPALAGSDTTFGAAADQLAAYTEGSVGKVAGIASLLFAVVSWVARFDWKLIGSAVGIGIAASTGPSIVGAMATATF